MTLTGNEIIEIRKKFSLNRKDFSIFLDMDISYLIYLEKFHNKKIIDPRLTQLMFNITIASFQPFLFVPVTYIGVFNRKMLYKTEKHKSLISKYKYLLSADRKSVINIICMKKGILELLTKEFNSLS